MRKQIKIGSRVSERRPNGRESGTVCETPLVGRVYNVLVRWPDGSTSWESERELVVL